MGGEKANPSYNDVASGKQHRETVKVVFDPASVSYQQLLAHFGACTTVRRDRQFCRSSPVQFGDILFGCRTAATGRRWGEALDASGKFDTPIATSIEQASEFYVAEEYHQDYYLKSPLKYKYYRYRSGRDQFIEAMWAGDNTVYQSTQ